MSVSMRARSAPSSPRTERAPDTGEDGNVTLQAREEASLKLAVAELHFRVPEGSRKTQLPHVNKQIIPDELLVSLTSAVCNRSSLGQTAHHRHCKGCGIRRPDAVWNHPLGRKKYKYFLEQPTSVTGAGRDISFLCDSVATQRKTAPLPPLTDRSGVGDTQSLSVSESLIPEEYHIVKNKGLQSLELYEDAFTVQLQDDEQKLRVFPSLRPSGRLEAVQLMKTMDDMLMKAGVDKQREELTELSQMEALLELVQVEQNIYNIVFHELIRQVSVNCAERGQLLAKLRQRYQSLFERIPHRLKALHTEVVAQRALDRRLTEEILRIKISIQQLSTELSRIRDHDAFVTQQAELAHQQLAEALEQTQSNSDVVQGYHELYELQRGRLEAQLFQMTQDRDHWSQLTFRLALKLISIKKLHMINQLHINEHSWFKTAEHCRLYINSKDTEDLNIITELTAFWKEQLATLMSQLKKTEYAQRERLNAINQGIAEWLNICTTQNKSPDPKNQKTSLEKIHAEFKQWSNTLAIHSERYQGEKLLCSQRTLDELGRVQERWLNFSHQLLRRHPSPDGEPPGHQQAIKELDSVLSELLKQLDKQASRARGSQEQITSLHGLIESWVSNLGQQEKTSVCDWLKLEETLHSWQSLAEKVMQTENENETEPNIYTMTEEASDKVRVFLTSLSRFTDDENHRLSKEASSIHMAQIRWMLDLLVLMIPDYSEDQSSEQDHHCMTNVSLKTLDEDAKLLIEKLDYFSGYITSSCKLILEEQSLQGQQEDESENEMNECIKLQAEYVDWVEICLILLSKVKGASVEQPVRQTDPACSCDTVISPADTMETLVNEEVSAEPTADNEAKDETETEPREGELTVCESPIVKLIGSDGNITQRRLGESSVHLDGTEELVVSPATDEAQKAFSDLTTVALLQQELHDSELRTQSAEERALRVEEALQAALEKIQDLEKELQGRLSLEPKSSEEKEETPPPATPPAPPKKATAEAKTTSGTKRTKKR